MLKIEIDGTVRRSFLFPADCDTALFHYSNFPQNIAWLPHISLVEIYDDQQYRMMFSSVELGIYRVRIFCDLKVTKRDDVLLIRPLEGRPPVRAEAGVNTLTAQGFYSSESTFRPQNGATRVNYRLSLRARLPVPFAARFMPASMLDLIAGNILNRHIHEIAGEFITRSVTAYRKKD